MTDHQQTDYFCCIQQDCSHYSRNHLVPALQYSLGRYPQAQRHPYPFVSPPTLQVPWCIQLLWAKMLLQQGQRQWRAAPAVGGRCLHHWSPNQLPFLCWFLPLWQNVDPCFLCSLCYYNLQAAGHWWGTPRTSVHPHWALLSWRHLEWVWPKHGTRREWFPDS